MPEVPKLEALAEESPRDRVFVSSRPAIQSGPSSTFRKAPQAAPEALWPNWLLPGAWVEDT